MSTYSFLFVVSSLCSMSPWTVKDSIIDLIAAYYAFDISYPKSLSAILFFQHFVMGIKDQQTIPIATAKLIGNLNKLG